MIILTIEITVLIYMFFKIIYKFDKNHNLHMDRIVILIIGACTIFLSGFLSVRVDYLPKALLYGVLASYLITAAIADYQTQLVHDFLHVIGLLAGVVLYANQQPEWPVVKGLLLFVGIQLLIFKRMYGTADCFTFIVCAVFMACSNHGLLTYLWHMGATIILLGVIQGFRRNINKRGNLKAPVALVPYIAITVWIFI